MVVSKTCDEDRANAGELERWCPRVEVFPAEPLPPDPARAPEPIKLLRHRCDELTRRVREVVAGGQVELVHVEGFYLMQHVPPELDVPGVLAEQNVEYELERQEAREASLAAVRTMRAEVAAWRRADLVGVLTPEDR